MQKMKEEYVKQEEEERFNKTLINWTIASKWKEKRWWNNKHLMKSAWEKVNETICFVDDFLKSAEETS